MPAFEEEHVPQGAEDCEERGEDEDEEDDDNYDGDNDEGGECDDLSTTESSDGSQLNSPQKFLHLPPAKEKQISVDPVSLKQSAQMEAHLSSSSTPPPPKIVKRPPPPLPSVLPRPKFLSSSLPCSAASSPQSNSVFSKNSNKWRNPTQKPHPAFHSLACQHSMVTPQFALQHKGMPLRRSKSCGEGRACPPSDEFDIMSRRRPNTISQPENGIQVIYNCTNDSTTSEDPAKVDEEKEEAFKCGALCLFLPGLSKKKQEQLQLQADQDEKEEEHRDVISRMASLERFECGSWSSSAILDGNEEDSVGGVQSYFDLPLELIRSSANDAHSPVKTAFVFERDCKGVLKKSTSRLAPRKSHESSNRHVRFSTSAPTSFPPSPTSPCITPRLLKAREEFNALLEAQSAYINF